MVEHIILPITVFVLFYYPIYSIVFIIYIYFLNDNKKHNINCNYYDWITNKNIKWLK